MRNALPGGTNARNGHSSKGLRNDDRGLEVNVPRDREGNFKPILVPKYQRSFDGFDEAILSLYSRVLTTRNIQGHFEHMYSRSFTNADLQNRGLRDVFFSYVDGLSGFPEALENVYPQTRMQL